VDTLGSCLKKKDSAPENSTDMFKNRSRTVSIIIQDVSDDDIAGVVQEILET